MISKHVFNFFRDNLLISVQQSGFTPSDSVVNQLLVIYMYHELCLAGDQQKEVRLVFWISAVLLLRFGMLDCYTNLKKIASAEIDLTGSLII